MTDQTGPPMADGIPGRQQLTGYRMRDYNHAIATLASSRESQRITLMALGARTGKHYQQIWRWLHGESEPYAGNLVALADALGYDLALIPRESNTEGIGNLLAVRDLAGPAAPTPREDA